MTPAPDPPYPSKQLAMHQLLLAARKTVLESALAEAIGTVDPQELGDELAAYAPADARQRVAQAGIRDERVFATPVVLRNHPTTLGYYRLLLGVSQKQFYVSARGLSRFKSMERRGRLTAATAALLPDLCKAMNLQMAELIAQLDPPFSLRDVAELPLLTLGAQFDGVIRVDIGKAATAELFLVIREIVQPHLTHEAERSLTLTNAAGRKVRIVLAADPDVSILEEFGDEERLNVAIEIKGGTDRSNAHNRAGEAEKSHRKVRNNTGHFWTVIALRGVSMELLTQESPTTTEWFNVSEVFAREGADFDKFRTRLIGAVGIS